MPSIRRTPTALVNITVALTSTTLYQITTGLGVTGLITAPARIVKIMATSRQALNVTLQIGELVAAAFTPRIPDIQLVPNIEVILTEEEIPGFLFESDIIGQASAAGVGVASIQVLLEVEENRA